MTKKTWTRREALITAGAASLMPTVTLGEERKMIARPIPSSGEELPVIGLGTWQVFDLPGDPENITMAAEIVGLLLGEGASVIDTSPMYNRSERMIGDVIDAGSPRGAMFLATKVWTNGRDSGIRQMDESARLMNTNVIDLMQVHNLRDTAVHMATIRERQDLGTIRYNGLTHYRAGALDALEAEMKMHKPDFIQINYSCGEREAEDRLLPLANDMGIAVLINRPYQGGALFRKVSGRAVPEWAAEFATSWGQFFLKFIVSNPAVTCVIPGTSKPHHMADNLEAGFGALPDAATRKRMIDFMDSL